MLAKIHELVLGPLNYTISFEYIGLDKKSKEIVVRCQIGRKHIKKLPVQSLGRTEESALDAALSLLQQVQHLERIKAIDTPFMIKNHEDAFYREKHVDDYWIEFQVAHGNFVISDIYRKDKFGFNIIKYPYPLPAKAMEATETNIKQFLGEREDANSINESLSPDEKLYIWNDIDYLTGSAGYYVVIDGKVIRTKTVIIA